MQSINDHSNQSHSRSHSEQIHDDSHPNYNGSNDHLSSIELSPERGPKPTLNNDCPSMEL